MSAAARQEGTGVEILNTGNRQDRGLGRVDQRVALLCREIAACKHLNACLLRLDIREKGDAISAMR